MEHEDTNCNMRIPSGTEDAKWNMRIPSGTEDAKWNMRIPSGTEDAKWNMRILSGTEDAKWNMRIPSGTEDAKWNMRIPSGTEDTNWDMRIPIGTLGHQLGHDDTIRMLGQCHILYKRCSLRLEVVSHHKTEKFHLLLVLGLQRLIMRNLIRQELFDEAIHMNYLATVWSKLTESCLYGDF